MIFLRHPRPDVAPGICYGRLDLGLAADAGASIGQALAATPRAEAVLASPAARCRALADALAARDGLTVAIEPGLAELDFGAWEGRAWDDIDRAESDPWAADPWRVAPPGGETFGALHARVGAMLARAPRGAVIVSHAGPIRAARMILAGASFETVFTTPVPYARPIVLSRVKDNLNA
ncbi:histidine phosphatase family protein [Limibaculum sp. M0105]|uniref:Histidine phosphatase family protein n=1 Tax=Thermohalobaculum xanthum TaxID=2753746 RepID=A0A8J7M442_9RHOB|nr:histidine phosphatase family protein [Thermohalobaculum xanthum]MBK0397833.1 histidine phosphatase family protein [Thermohalobaculum xanthum]